MQKLLQQFAKYATVGAGATAIHVAAALIFNSLFALSALRANFCAFLVASTFTFFGNYFWTFSTSGKLVKIIPRFIFLTLSCFAVNQSIVYCITALLQKPLWVAMIPVILVIPAMGFWMSKTKVFVSPSATL